MSQHDYSMANQSGSLFRTDLNNVLDSVVTNNSGASAPATLFAFMWWYDTTNNWLKRRNSTNTAWLNVCRTANSAPIYRPIQSFSSDHTVLESEIGNLFRATANLTLNMTAVATLGDGWWCQVKGDGGAVIIDPSTTEQIDGATTITVANGDSAIVICSGSDFRTMRIVSPVGKMAIPVPVTAMTPRSANGCGALASSAGASGQPDVPYLPFDGAAKEFAGFLMWMPSGWNEGTVTAKFSWRRASGTGAANVVWGMRAVAVSDNETPAVAFGSDATVTDAASTTTANMNLSGETGVCTIGGTPSASDLVFFEVFRDGASGSDTLDSVDALLTAITLFITTDAAADA